jgi:proteasome lid subunit RPN8/RPN11
MRLFRSSGVAGIARDTLDFALEAAEDTHPDEYMGVLRGEPASNFAVDRSGYVITDVLVIPGTTSSPVSATLDANMVPNDQRTVGSIHSHPNGVLRPSDEDVATFGKGEVHVIMGAPYRPGDWRAFDRQGEPRSLEVLDVDLPDPEEFFHFDQSDIDEELRERGWDEDADGWGDR